jgi:hypothetical protein
VRVSRRGQREHLLDLDPDRAALDQRRDLTERVTVRFVSKPLAALRTWVETHLDKLSA